jgi:hypothetical protein
MSLRCVSLVALVLSTVSAGSASAALQIFYTKASYDAALTTNGLGFRPNQSFDSESLGFKGASYPVSGMTLNYAGDLEVYSGETSSPTNFLGASGGFGDFSGGDSIGIVLPAGTRGIALNVVTDSFPEDFTNFASLIVSATQATTEAYASPLLDPIPIPSSSFQSYFLGIVGDTAGDAFTNATVNFNGSVFYRVDDIQYAAVPEPTSLALLGGVAALGLIRRRNR